MARSPREMSAGRLRAKADPEFTDSPENNVRKVAENARVGTRLGKAINAIDADGTPTYTVDNANFSISTSGQLSTAAILDHEEDEETQTVTITATDPWGGTDTIDVTVTVEDVNEAPMINTGPTRRDHAENTPITALIGDYGATDVDEGDTPDLTWSLEGEDAAKFNIVRSRRHAHLRGIPQLRDACGPQQGQRLQGNGHGVRRRDPETDGQAAGRSHRNQRRGGRHRNPLRRPAQDRD